MDDRVYGRRFSERGAFWGLCAALLSAVCLYVYIKIHEARLWPVAGTLWVFLCLAAALISFAARRTKLLRSRRARLFADRCGGLWFVFVIWSCLLLFSAGALNGLLGLGAGGAELLCLSFAAAFVLVAFGVCGALKLSVTSFDLRTGKLPHGVDSLRVVQITDLHLDPLSGFARLSRLVETVRAAAPDIVVATGDVTDGNLAGREREAELFHSLKPRYGFFAVTGNHDYYDGLDESLDFMRRAGMRVLRGEAAEAGGIVVEGADDRDHLARGEWGLTRSETLIVNTYSRNRGKFILLLRHRPIVETGTEGFFDLQLSGHTHGGQLFPLFSSRLFVRGHSRGLKKLRKGSMLYTSNGAGFVGPPVRLFAPPEIVVIDIKRKEEMQLGSSSRV